jgi:2-haloalkanoic acid dehalogenase type II
MPRPKLIAFDFFGTLVANEEAEWLATLSAIVEEQSLDIPGPTLHAEWSAREQNFRKTRTNMADPPASPPFRTYWQAWRDAFAETFADLGLPGDADAAATRCVEDHRSRKAFADTNAALIQLVEKAPLAIMSNADDRFLDGSIAFNQWSFDPVISSESAQAYKPDPRAFAALCTATGVAPADILYVGDSPYDDAHGAKLAGMQTVLINRDQRTPGRTPPPDATQLLAPDHEITALTELPALLDLLAKVRTTP